MILTYEKIAVDTESAIVTYDGIEIFLLLQEYRLLLLFLKHPRHVLSYQFIVDQIWEDLDKIPTYSTVRTHIKRLRQSFKRANVTAEIIETVHGFGYRLKSPSQAKYTPSLPLMQKFIKAKAIEYIVIDRNLKVQYISPLCQDYCDYPKNLEINQGVREAFPELIGLETVIKNIIDGKLEAFELCTVARSVNTRRPKYINFYFMADYETQEKSEKDSLLFIFLEDNSEQIIYQQRLVQTANESFLLLEQKN